MVFIFLNKCNSNSKKLDIITIKNKYYIHKQVEVRDGLLFVRLKKRSLTPIHA